jgi:hypothetical protein
MPGSLRRAEIGKSVHSFLLIFAIFLCLFFWVTQLFIKTEIFQPAGQGWKAPYPKKMNTNSVGCI